ncbi:MAG: DUF5134 domain-containing protein [Pseudonocardiales bacterium]|nr:DUF5134 domain-containing protein [Pseudonocardiales bacterium]
MPGWLGVTLTGMFAAVTLHRVRCRNVPGSLMAIGMAAMAIGMGGIGPHVVHGPWWAAGFAALALWPVLALARGLRPDRGSVLHGHLPHLVGCVAMVYMCVAGLTFISAPGSAAASGSTAGGTAVTGGFQLVGEHDHGRHSALAATVTDGPGSLGAGLFALAGWLLAGYLGLAMI